MKIIADAPARRLLICKDGDYIVIEEQERTTHGTQGDRRRRWIGDRVAVTVHELRLILEAIEKDTL